MKKIISLILVFVIVFSLSACTKKTKISTSGKECGTLTINGSLGNSGKIKVTGNVVDNYYSYYEYIDEEFSYKRDGNRLTLTPRGKLQGTLTGTYDSNSNTLVLDTKSYCEFYKKNK